MAYSTIKKKTCRVPDCTNYPGFGMAGFCYKHIPEEVAQEIKVERDNARKKANARVADKAKLRKLGRLSHNENDLELFFKLQMNERLPICENCGSTKMTLKKLQNEGYQNLWKSCMAHLLPKRHFKSIATNPLNLMVLGSGYSGMCNCHDTYDSNWEAASKMKIWDEVVRRFKVLYPLVADHERQFIPDVLLKTLDNG